MIEKHDPTIIETTGGKQEFAQNKYSDCANQTAKYSNGGYDLKGKLRMVK